MLLKVLDIQYAFKTRKLKFSRKSYTPSTCYEQYRPFKRIFLLLYSNKLVLVQYYNEKFLQNVTFKLNKVLRDVCGFSSYPGFFFFVFLMSFFHAKCENNLIWFKLWMSHSEELVWLYIMALCAHAICIWSFQNNIRNKNCSVLLSLNFLSTPNYFFNVTVLYFVLFCFFTLIHF